MAIDAAASNDESMARLAADITTAMERINSRSSEPFDNATATTSSGPTASVTTHQATDSGSFTRAAESPTDNFVTPPTDQSPEDSLDLSDRRPSVSSNQRITAGKPSSITSMPKAARRRSSSGAGAILARLTSRSSVSTTGGASIESHPPTSPSGRPKLDMDALTRQKSKYKSGVNWDNPDIMGKYEEPFEVSTSPVDERNAADSPLYEKVQENALRELASAGGTKAALAQANANTIGVPFFPTSHRAVMDMQQDAAAAAFRGKQRSPPVATSPTAMSPPLARETSPRSLNSGSSTNDDAAQQQKFTPEEAQRRLQSARDAVAMANAAVKVPPGAAEQPAASPPLAQAPEEKKADVSIETKRKARRSFIQLVSGSKDKESKKKGSKSGKKGVAAKNSSRSASPSGSSATPTRRSSSTAEAANTSTPATSYTNGTTSPADSTIGRRRRFNDTRELNLVASQLAAEALMPPSPPIVGLGTHSSMIGMMASSPPTSSDARMTGNVSPPLGSGSIGHASSVTHGQHNSLNGLGGAPQPPFAADNRSIGGSSSVGGGSPRHGSPRLEGMYEPPRAAFARPSPGGSPTLTQSAKLSGLPSDMLTGLNDGPYPFLPPRAFELSDPFAAPSGPMDFEVGGRPGSIGGRNSLPGSMGGTALSMSRSRGMSSGSVQTSNGGTATPGRRSVLQMTMHNPEQELQGLTKPPKSGRSTPFGSRGPSRQVTPNASVTNLRELAKEEAEKANVALKEAAKAAKASRSRTADRASEGGAAPKSNGGQGASVSKGSRLSLFRKNKSATDLNAARATSSDLAMTTARTPSAATTQQQQQQLKPPAALATMNGGGGSATESTNTIGSSQSRLSASNDSMTSRPMSIPTTDEQHGAVGAGNSSARVNASAQSLVKVPSPSMTSTSGSSHDRSGFASSEGGASGMLNASNVTTPDMQAAAIAKPDVSMPRPPMPVQSAAATAQSAPKHMAPQPQPQLQPAFGVMQQQPLAPPQSRVPTNPQMMPPPNMMQRPMAPAAMPRPPPPPQSSLPVHPHMSQTHDPNLTKTSPATSPSVRPGMPASRSASANRVGSSVDTVMAKRQAATTATTPASSTHSAAATSRPKLGKFMSRFSSRGNSTTHSSPASTPPPPLPTSGGAKAFASRSQGHLPASAAVAASGQHTPIAAGTPPLPTEAKSRANSKFNSFRSNFQRDWFV